MPKTVVRGAGIPPADGAYSQAVKANSLVFITWQLPVESSTGRFVPGGIAEKTHQVFRNLQTILAAADSSLDSIVETTVYMEHMGEFPEMDAVYKTYFPAGYPVRVVYHGAFPPAGYGVAIEAIAACAYE